MSRWLVELPARIGQLFVRQEAAGRVAICHRDDVDRDDLTVSELPEAGIEIARFDDNGDYRPLKTAPNLRHGWKLLLEDIEQGRRAVDFIYPGRRAAFLAWEAGALRTTALRETLGRQSGMYRVAARVTDEEADDVVAKVCRSDGGCLRTILWKQNGDERVASALLPKTKFDPAFDQTGCDELSSPLLCQEGCNILVAEMRKAVKA